MFIGASCQVDGKKKPESVLYYNGNKCGVDMLDAMCRMMSTKAGCRRWPLAVFFNILDLAAVNAWIIYKKRTGINISRRNFIRKLSEELIGLEEPLAGADHPTPSTSGSKKRKLDKRVVCSVKRNCKRNLTATCCSSCKLPVCGMCTADSGANCVDKIA